MFIHCLISLMSLDFPLSSSAFQISRIFSILIFSNPNLPDIHLPPYPRFLQVFIPQSLAIVRHPNICQSSVGKYSEFFSPEIFTNLQP